MQFHINRLLSDIPDGAAQIFHHRPDGGEGTGDFALAGGGDPEVNRLEAFGETVVKRIGITAVIIGKAEHGFQGLMQGPGGIVSGTVQQKSGHLFSPSSA
jgi:hypothetical protein